MRNFLYNKSDILIAIVIIAVAAVIIWTRVDAIMGTPDEKSKDTPTVTSETTPTPPAVTDGSNGGEAPEVLPTPDEEEDGTTTDSGVTDDPVTGDEEPVEFTVDVGSAASTVANDLEAAGLVESADAFINELEKQNAVTKLKAGTFKIPVGASVSEIVKKLTN